MSSKVNTEEASRLFILRSISLLTSTLFFYAEFREWPSTKGIAEIGSLAEGYLASSGLPAHSVVYNYMSIKRCVSKLCRQSIV